MFIEMSTLIIVRRVKEGDENSLPYMDSMEIQLYNEGLVIERKECKRTINTDDIMDIIPNDDRWQMEDLYDKAIMYKLDYKPVRELITIRMRNNTKFGIMIKLDDYDDYANPFVKDVMDKCEWFDNIQRQIYNNLVNTIKAKRII